MTGLWRQGRVTAVALAVALVLPVGAASAQQAVVVDILRADFQDDGTTELIVSVTGSAVDDVLSADAFSVREGESTVEDVTVSSIEDAADVPARTAMILFDISGSTAGEALDNAKAAAVGFVEEVTAVGVSVGLVTFSDQAQLVVEPTGDPDVVVAAIAALEAGGETAFFDAVLVAARTLQNISGDGERSILAFTDGADTASQANLQAAINAADTVEAAVSPVALTTGDLDLDILASLATATGGQLREAAAAEDLSEAFDEVAATLTSQYVLSYTSFQETGEFTLSVDVTLDGTTATDTISLLSPRQGRGVGEPRAVEVVASDVFTNRGLLFGSLAAVFAALALILGLVLVPTGDRRVARTLERGLRVYRRGEAGARVARTSAGTVGARAVGLVESFPKPEGYDERVQADLDRASWPLRAAEFTTLRILAAIVGVMIGWGILESLLIGLVIGAAAWLMPGLVLAQRVTARRKKFLEQLPDTLQLLSGALKAGYGILQAIDTIVKETAEPTSGEFQRVLTEARLGLPLEEALESMAERIDSEDFRWVTVAINIQRRVGGNLAELLETVSETLREREMVRRQIDVLSAEGRLSAVILTVLPFGLAGYLYVVNPDYIGELFSRTIGQLMVVGAIILMAVGVLWMKRLVEIDV